MLRLFAKTINILRSDGLEILLGKLTKRVRGFATRYRYQRWIRDYRSLTDLDVISLKKIAQSLVRKPLISVLMPVYNTDEKYLRVAIESVRSQIYENWELCISDDFSTSPHIRLILGEYAAADSRIKVIFRDRNGHISAASNSALDIVTGEYTALLDHDDELSNLALFFVAREINNHPEAEILYSDEDKIDARGVRYDPYFKPDWNAELLLGVNYVNHLSVYRTTLLQKCGGFRSLFDGSQDYDLLLRAVECCQADSIRHIPHVLYHWRSISGSVAYASDEKPYAHERARTAITEHFGRTGVASAVSRGIGQLHNVTYKLPDNRIRVSVIVWGSELAGDLRSVLGIDRQSLIKVDIASAGVSMDTRCETPMSQLTGNPFDAVNRLALESDGDVLCFLNSDISWCSEGWLETLASHAIQPGVGAVGPMIYDKAAHIVSAGCIIGSENGVESAFHDQPITPRGRSLRLDIPQNVSAVSADCLVISAKTFLQIGGFSHDWFGAYSDVDLCLRLDEQGFKTVWTPRIELRQDSSSLSKIQDGIPELKAKWPAHFASDPYHNPNLSLDVRGQQLAYPPRIEKF